MVEELKVIIASFFTYDDGLRFNTNNFVYETSSPALNNLKIMKDIKELMQKINNSGNVLKSTKCTFFIDLVLVIPIIIVWNLPLDTFGEKEQTNRGIQVLVSIIFGVLILVFTCCYSHCCGKEVNSKQVKSSLFENFNTTRKSFFITLRSLIYKYNT